MKTENPKTPHRLLIIIDRQLHNQAKAKAYLEGKNLRIKVTELIQNWLAAK